MIEIIILTDALTITLTITLILILILILLMRNPNYYNVDNKFQN